MAHFSIYNVDAGEELGVYEADSEDGALDAMARHYGFKDYADSMSEYGVSIEDAKGELQIAVVRPSYLAETALNGVALQWFAAEQAPGLPAAEKVHCLQMAEAVLIASIEG